MKLLPKMRRWSIVLCITAVLLAVLMSSAIGLPFAVLAPLWFLLATVVVSTPLPCANERWDSSLPITLPVFSSRPLPRFDSTQARKGHQLTAD
jgi:hypothetical protein